MTERAFPVVSLLNTGTLPLSDENQRFSPALPEGEPRGVLFSWVHPFRDVSPFRIRPGLRRATFPAGKGFWGVPAPLSVFFWALALAVVFAVLPLIRQPFGLPPSPEGEGFGAAQPRMCYGKPTWSAGACPRPTHG